MKIHAPVISAIFLIASPSSFAAPKGPSKTQPSTSSSISEPSKDKDYIDPPALTASTSVANATEGEPAESNQNAPTPETRSWWNPSKMRHSVGVELADSAFGVLGTNAINYGYSTDKFGVDIYFGYTKGTDTTSTNITTSTNTIATPNTQTIVKTYDGEKSPKQTSIGVQPKLVVFGDKWFKASVGFMIARISSSSVSYQTGSTSTTIADTSKPGTFSVVNADVGTVSKSTTAKLIYGPRINTDFYLKWFPHIALGFGTGLMLSSGGDLTETTSTEDKSYSVIDNVEQKATSQSTSTSTKTTTTGGSASTVALGGSKFSLLGSFSIRYIW